MYDSSYIYDVPKIAKYRETESRIVFIREQGRQERDDCLTGIELQVGTFISPGDV